MAGETASFLKSKGLPTAAERKRKEYKLNLVELAERMKDSSIEKIVATFSGQTGLRFMKIYDYLDELEAQGLIKRIQDRIIVK